MFAAPFALWLSGFPWYFLVFGPLYSNLAVFVVDPAGVFVTIFFIESCCSGSIRVRDLLVVLVMGVVSPAATKCRFFRCGSFPVPICAGTMVKLLAERGVSAKKRKSIAAAAIGVVLIAWVLLWDGATVLFDGGSILWPATAEEGRAFFDVATLAMMSGALSGYLACLFFFRGDLGFCEKAK